ncbi:hypothetical protein [Spirosoma aerolatum]|uniref:hypothetical protein n=1 Tax=Spirosoma aerolatum TaxID=1211326 RepID=UPI0009AD8A55|nr:hypothetical protein [Spirosoma aerolatum]
MISLEKMRIYIKYKGDEDYCAHATHNKRTIMEDGDFFKIDSLLQDIELAEKGLITERYLRSLSEKLSELCDSSETISELKRMAKL